MFKKIRAALLLPSISRVKSYVDALTEADTWDALKVTASNLYPKQRDRARVHEALWGSKEQAARLICHIAEKCHTPAFSGKRGPGVVEGELFLFLATGEYVGVIAAHQFSNISKRMLSTYFEVFDTHPKEVLAITHSALRATAIYYTSADWFLYNKSPESPHYRDALFLAYDMMRGMIGEYRHNAITQLRPYFIKVMPKGVVDSIYLLEEDAGKIMERIDDYLVSKPKSATISLPTDLTSTY